MKIIYQGPNDNLAVMNPSQRFLNKLPSEWTEIEKMKHLADKDLPTGCAYEIVPEDYDISEYALEDLDFVAGDESYTSEDLTEEYLRLYRMTENRTGWEL